MTSLEEFTEPELKVQDPRHEEVLKSLEGMLHEFDSISLGDMDAAQLQDRMDTKFYFHIDSLPAILHDMKPHYRVFEINHYRINPYRTLYFDDERRMLYLLHHNRKMNRFKIRYRSYLSSGISFFEVKYKNNKNRTVKERVKVPGIAADIQGDAAGLLNAVTPLPAGRFHPSLWVNYSRITFVSHEKNERVTLDVSLGYKNPRKEKSLHDLVIAEVKQGRASTRSPFLRILKSRAIRPGSISKYCLGMALLEENLKINNFKPKLLAVQKLLKQPLD